MAEATEWTASSRKLLDPLQQRRASQNKARWILQEGRSDAALLFAFWQTLEERWWRDHRQEKVAGVSKGGLHRFAARAMAATHIAGKVNVLITDNRELRSLNRRFRKKDAATDVLSFPGTFNDVAGDIAISAEMATSNARKLGHSAINEIKILILHGVLHLAGYDHERDNGIMARKELQLRRAFKLPVGLIERYGRIEKSEAKRKSSRGGK